MEDAEALRTEAPSIAGVSPVTRMLSSTMRYQDKQTDTPILFGVTPYYEFVQTQYVSTGRFVNEVDMQDRSNVVIIGVDVKHRVDLDVELERRGNGAVLPDGGGRRIPTSRSAWPGPGRRRGRRSRGRGADGGRGRSGGPGRRRRDLVSAVRRSASAVSAEVRPSQRRSIRWRSSRARPLRVSADGGPGPPRGAGPRSAVRKMQTISVPLDATVTQAVSGRRASAWAMAERRRAGRGDGPAIRHGRSAAVGHRRHPGRARGAQPLVATGHRAVGDVEDFGDPAERGASVELERVQQPQVQRVQSDRIHPVRVLSCRIAAPWPCSSAGTRAAGQARPMTRDIHGFHHTGILTRDLDGLEHSYTGSASRSVPVRGTC